jgi:TRAP transporter TAXI family solute receptor
VTRLLRETLVQVWEYLAAWGPFLLVAVAALALAYAVLKPAPPHHVTIAVGDAQSAYAEFGRRYAAELRRNGIRVTLLPTSGSCENLKLLHDPKQRVDFAFVLGGSCDTARTADEAKGDLPLVSLGTLFYEPVWIFYRTDRIKNLSELAQLRGRKVNVGVRGSGAPGLASKLLKASFVDRGELQRSNLDEPGAVVALLGGKLDAIVMVSAPESQLVQMLLQTPGVKLLEFPQAEAYARRFPFISPVTLPRGVADLSRDVPPRDVPLIAATTSLVAREDAHPALVQLFVQAATKIHGGAGWIARAGQFPTPANTEFPLSPEAERYYKSGPPLLQRYLPFWMANLIDRMWVALFSIVAILIPLSRIVPPLYRFRVRSRVFRWYRQLRHIEDQQQRGTKPARDLEAELDKLEARAKKIVVPLSYADELYALRQHIDLARERLKRV